MWRADGYRAIFRYRAFRAFWLGFTVSALGDAMTRVALIWLVYTTTRSAFALGALLLCYTGPVFAGGWLAGWLLDRFDRRVVMLADNAIRGVVVAAIPVAYALGVRALWPLYAVAAVYGFLYMITLAGSPALIPALVPERQLATANALETLTYTLSGVIGPPVAGLLIVVVGAPNVLALDAVSYACFALALIGMRGSTAATAATDGAMGRGGGIAAAVALVWSHPVLLSTTLMFMAFNVGEGFLAVWLPIYADRGLGGGPELYGLLLAALAVGEVSGALLAGSATFPLPLGVLICGAQALAGASLGLLLFGPALVWTLPGLFLLGAFSAPLTIWAQTLRMRIIPERLRGRTFALLRTLMQGSGPLASAAAGVLLPAVGVATMIGCSALLVGVPGLIGYRVRALRAGATTQATPEVKAAV